MANDRSKKPTRDDLNKAAEAAMEAARVAESTAALVQDALEGGTLDDPEGEENQGGGRPRRQTRQPLNTSGESQQAAYEEFMAALQPVLGRVKDKVRVEEIAGWIKIEGVESKERVYVAKGKRTVARVTCTLAADQIDGAEEPSTPNGLIKSWLPATPEAVGQAIELIAGVPQEGGGPRKGGRRQTRTQNR